MSRPVRPLGAAATAAHAALPPSDADAFDRLASAVLASPGAALGAVLRARLPGLAGVRWLRTAGLPPTARASALTTEQWLSLYRCWRSSAPAPGAGPSGRAPVGRPSAHGHAPGALAAPRWQ
ncbi:hypothetical protein JOD57_001134 [Geodermatophilus bullaregiensis]|uniref:hypothetical protein n=1 Tax=Geodermatophilus bullaregiensis TaxID=1564160 RepID=UPI00195CD60E|nr:hypothetical protein [Geodermatophilus bullaregiensis]MBM7805297.1 hypothetical protein [Geodermatophilus bullaregiensis]